MNAAAEASSAPWSLPILTLDDSPLPRTFGYIFDRRWLGPYESIVSMLWKFARMNGIAGHVLVSQLRAVPIDPYEGISASSEGPDVGRVSRMLNVSPKLVRCSLGSISGRRAMHPRLRRCPRCITFGYHSVVHQFLCASRCPAHGEPLEEVCRACGEGSDYRLDARLFDAPFSCSRCRRPYSRTGRCRAYSHRLSARIRTEMTRAYLA